jgi:hypothetical protein
MYSARAFSLIQSNNNTEMADNSLLRNALIAVRFIVFGVFGFVVLIFAFVTLMDQLTSVRHANGHLVPLGLIAVSGLGAVMMLFGVGEWGRWGYLFVFLSFPVSLLLLFLLPHAGKDVGAIVPTLTSVGTYIVVRTYYARRKSLIRR